MLMPSVLREATFTLYELLEASESAFEGLIVSDNDTSQANTPPLGTNKIVPFGGTSEYNLPVNTPI
jgi:hypothetical protein